MKPSAAMVGLVEAPRVARSEMTRKPRTNLGNFCQRKAALLSSCLVAARLARPLRAQWMA